MTIQLYGALGSPYSMKIRAVLRYRRIPYVFVPSMPGTGPIKDVKPPVIPVLELDTGEKLVDSTPIIDALEAHTSERSLNISDPVMAFLDSLLEDFADEWLTKIMFMYRWRTAESQAFCGQFLVYDVLGACGTKTLGSMAQGFTQRQAGRMDMVGCTAASAPILAASFRTILSELNTHLADTPFLFGQQPRRADFALYGQLLQLESDPESNQIMREYPIVWRWVRMMDDAGGAPDNVEAHITPAAQVLLSHCVDIYPAFLKANAAAISAGESRFQVTLLGHLHEQPVFKYQAKCWQALQARYAALTEAAQTQVNETLGGRHF